MQMRAGAAGSNALVGEWRGHPRWELGLRRLLVEVQRASHCDGDRCGPELQPPRVHVYRSTKIWLAYATFRVLPPDAAIPEDVGTEPALPAFDL